MTSTQQEARPSRTWWQRPWVLPLAFVAVAFLAFSLPPYLSLRPELSRIPAPPEHPWYYPALVGHVLFGSVAMVACCLQVWPWLRRRHPEVHRTIGRIYVFGGVLPGGLFGLSIGIVSPAGPTLQVSSVLLACLWLGCTYLGYRNARRRRFVAHRRWMIRSFALTMSIITNRITGILWIIALLPELGTTYAGSMDGLIRTAASVAAWTGWMGSLLVAEWWLHRGRSSVTRS
ncbi:DUF2306 domain-containing protein [Actinomycetes bacterium KLBMP 9759]